MNDKLEFEIRQVVDDKRVRIIQAGSFKEAIEEFSKSFNISEAEKYVAIYGENKVEFQYINSCLKLFS